MVKEFRVNPDTYPVLGRFAQQMGLGDVVKIQNREAEVNALRAAMSRPVISNAMMLGGAGTGKTAIVEYFAANYAKRNEVTFELDVVSMAQNGRDEFNAYLKMAMDEVQKIQKRTNVIFDIFIDEFHVVAMNGGTDAIKPILARSGSLNVHIIAATTDEEYFEYIKPNQALDQRMQPIKLAEPSDAEMLPILRSTVKHYAPEMNQYFSDRLLRRIISYGKFQPEFFQPRKSILIVDTLIGDFRAFGTIPTIPHLNKRIEMITGAKPDWSMNIDDVVRLLKSRVKGQDAAIETMKNSLTVSVAGLQDPTRPMGSFLFTGTTGTGKTELARTLASAVFGTEKAMMRFDMSEFQTKESVEDFQEKITTRLTKNPYTILLFDELEKAHSGVRNLLLQLLDDGRMTNRYGRQVNGLNAYIIMTTNLGAETIGSAANRDDDVREVKSLLFAELAITLAPEFLGRISAIVPFQPLSNQVLAEITKLRFAELNKRTYRKYGVKLKMGPEQFELMDGFKSTTFKTPKLVAYLVADHVKKDANAGGGRAIANRMYEEVAPKVAALVKNTSKPHLKYDYLEVSVTGKLVLENKYDAEGTAEIQVKPHVRKKSPSKALIR